MVDIARDADVVELNDPPRFKPGECVACRSVVRNDGTFTGAEIGEVLVNKGDIGFVVSVGTFLQQYYIYAVEWMPRSYRVGMRAKELLTLDNLPDDVLQALGPEKIAQLTEIKRSRGTALPDRYAAPPETPAGEQA